ncbi:Synaptopodin 2-like protein [Cricetulus griseus]|uniref:Synaptopodin 2-like protein n=1 Tax=Cricetulus griseus TaxID=10029 RepID=G3GWP0_CRIGR|nr:Synaptopodin 2-like protein [Cricetulus griseus]
MGAEEEVQVTLAGGAPWGFRLQGGAEQKKPLQVSKIRRRSQAGRAGLRERDQLLAINGVSCTNFSHASAMTLIDASGHQLVLTVRRVSDEGSVRSPSPGGLRVLSPLSPLSPEPPGAPAPQAFQPGSLRSPPDSEAYYGETDSDVDGPATQEKPRRTRRRGPTRPSLPGAPPDEVYLSDSPAEPAPAKTGSPSQGDSRVSSPSWEEGTALQPPPAEALLLPHGPLRPGPHLIPMVGPVPHPVGEDLTTTYTQKAKQATSTAFLSMEAVEPIIEESPSQATCDKAPAPELQDPFYAELQRAESLQEKSVKEAKTKCRTIASLLTAAPNPHSKGVLMFKKRRQRAKKYTLVSFGAAAGTGTEEEDGIPPTSESELDEEAFSDARSLTNQSDWDSPYLDMELARAASGTTESQSSGLGGKLSEVSGRGVQLFEQQRQRAASSTQELTQVGPAAMLNGQGLQSPPRAQSAPPEAAVLPLGPLPAPTANPSPFFPDGGAPSPAPSIFNRSARPFTPGLQGQRSGLLDGLVNGSTPLAGIPELPRLQGRGGELFAKRQSRADRYVVEATPGASLNHGFRPRSPSPTPSLPPSWKYSPNIRAPPPIAYNPLLSPFFPQAARTLPNKAQSQGPRATPKQGIKALDFMRHQPYQLKTAMFCFDEVPSTPGPTSGPPKTARVQEIRRFSTPAPQPTAEPLAPTVLAPRAATTLDEPIWRAELASPPVPNPDYPQESPRSFAATPSSCGFQVKSISIMPLSGTPAPNKRRKPSKLIMELTGGGRENSGLNLGKKISVPRDVMLEELSLLTNRGSKMFKLRQMRVEKFIYENHPDVFSDSSMDHFQKFLPTVGGQLETAGQGFSYGKGSSGGQAGGSGSAGQYGSDQHHQQGSGFGAGGAGGPGGQAGRRGASGTAGTGEPGTGSDQAGGEGKHVTVFKTYISPWDRAMGVDPQQKVELGIDLLAYGAKAELPKYKSFNRTAMPYGGYEKASKRMTFQMPKFDLGPLLSEPLVLYNQNLSNRPSFNRTPIPWLSSGEPVDYTVDIGIPLDGETEEL